jgi:uncharacterized protein associated with vWA-MoxR-VMAP ternary system
MAIREFSSGSPRRRIVCVGEMPPNSEHDVFAERGYQLKPFRSELLTEPVELAALDSVVFSQRAKSPTQVVLELEQYAPRLLDHDCRVYVRLATSDVLRTHGRDIIVNALRRLRLPVGELTDLERAALSPEEQDRQGLPLAPFVYICDLGHTWARIAELISNNPAGKAPKLELVIDAVDAQGRQIPLSEARELLLKRAFDDCEVIHLRQMQDGLSGVCVFRAHAQLAGGLEGRGWPVLYFVKIGDRRKITTEYEKYQGHALLYIPFNLGPRLNLARCGLGARDAIIVGDFVDQAEALKQCASGGRAAHALGNLFSRTLRAWHNAAIRHEGRTVFECLDKRFPTQIPEDRAPLIRAYGAQRSLSDLRTALEQVKTKPVLIGTIHGDLNASNILIRGGDSIVIDFEQLSEGMPLVYDAASVEAGLFVDGFAGDTRDPLELLDSVAALYESRRFFDWLKPCHPKDSSAWFYECVRIIRLHTQQFELNSDQYAAALAFAYIKKACNRHLFGDKRDELRALGYVIAEKILGLLSTATQGAT